MSVLRLFGGELTNGLYSLCQEVENNVRAQQASTTGNLYHVNMRTRHEIIGLLLTTTTPFDMVSLLILMLRDAQLPAA